VKGYVFDPSRLRGSRRQQERRGYAMAGRMLREHLGGDPLAEFRRRAQRDPVLRAMLAQAAAELQAAAHKIEATTREADAT
jgi:hypothetical protein